MRAGHLLGARAVDEALLRQRVAERGHEIRTGSGGLVPVVGERKVRDFQASIVASMAEASARYAVQPIGRVRRAPEDLRGRP